MHYEKNITVRNYEKKKMRRLNGASSNICAILRGDSQNCRDSEVFSSLSTVRLVVLGGDRMRGVSLSLSLSLSRQQDRTATRSQCPCALVRRDFLLFFFFMSNEG